MTSFVYHYVDSSDTLVHNEQTDAKARQQKYFFSNCFRFDMTCNELKWAVKRAAVSIALLIRLCEYIEYIVHYCPIDLLLFNIGSNLVFVMLLVCRCHMIGCGVILSFVTESAGNRQDYFFQRYTW